LKRKVRDLILLFMSCSILVIKEMRKLQIEDVYMRRTILNSNVTVRAFTRRRIFFPVKRACINPSWILGSWVGLDLEDFFQNTRLC
jgi:hypothetical protein